MQNMEDGIGDLFAKCVRGAESSTLGERIKGSRRGHFVSVRFLEDRLVGEEIGQVSLIEWQNNIFRLQISRLVRNSLLFSEHSKFILIK